MIERVAIAGTDVDLLDVFAAVTLRHGRGDVEDGPLASTATLSLVNVTRELSSVFRVADELRVELAAGELRFLGRITDARFSDGSLSIIAVSSLSWLSRRPVGLVDYPEELWSDRVHRVLGEAEALTSWRSVAGTWADSTETWETVETSAIVEVGDVDPLLSARLAEETTLGAYLGELIESNPAAIAQLPNGALLVQELTARRGRTTVELDPDLVAANPEWIQTDELANRVTVEWAGGETTSVDQTSIARFEEREDDRTTELALLEDADDLADRDVARRAWPRWELSRVDLLELDASLTIGDPVSVSELEDGAPSPSYLGVVEGWEDHIESDSGELEWTMVLSLSPPRYSGFGLSWEAMPIEETWSSAGAATWTEPELALSN